MAGNGLWDLAACRDSPRLLDVLDALSCKVVYLKIFDDLHGPSLWADQCSEELVGRFSQRGIKVIGWGYHFDKTHTPDLALSA